MSEKAIKRPSYVDHSKLLEAGPNQSSVALAYMNALILRGNVSVECAQAWQSHEDYEAWAKRFEAWLAGTEPKAKLSLPVRNTTTDFQPTCATQLSDKLQVGYVAVVQNQSDARTVYRPQELSQYGIYVHDSVNLRPRGVFPTELLDELAADGAVLL